jgi:hypothetical protein
MSITFWPKWQQSSSRLGLSASARENPTIEKEIDSPARVSHGEIHSQHLGRATTAVKPAAEEVWKLLILQCECELTIEVEYLMSSGLTVTLF